MLLLFQEQKMMFFKFDSLHKQFITETVPEIAIMPIDDLILFLCIYSCLN